MLLFWLVLTFLGTLSDSFAAQPPVPAKVTQERCESQLAPEQGAFEAPEFQRLFQNSPRLGDYSLVEVNASGGKTKVVVDAQAPWILNELEAFAKKPAAQANQNDIKAFLKSLDQGKLSSMPGPSRIAFGSATRSFDGSEPVYYLDELMRSNKPSDRDLATMLIGQALLERIAKKQAAVVQTAEGQYGLLIKNRALDFFSLSCHDSCVPASNAVLSVEMAPSSDKNNRRIEIFDLKGVKHTIQVIGRSPLDRMVRAAGEQFRAAQSDEAVDVELYFFPQYWPDGHTSVRIGDVAYNFGKGGWGRAAGPEGIRGELINNPFLRGSINAFAGVNVPLFALGIQMSLPKGKLQKVIDAIEYDFTLPPDQKLKFDSATQNCNQVILRLFESAGIPIASSEGYAGSSSSWTFRDLFLHPPAFEKAVNLYPMPGSELTDGQIRDLFPKFLYRHHTIENDREFGMIDQTKADYRKAILLQYFSLGLDENAALENLRKREIIKDHDSAEYPELIAKMKQDGLLGPDNSLTPAGLAELERDRTRYNLQKMMPN